MTDKTDAELDELELNLRSPSEREAWLFSVPYKAATAISALRKQLDEAREEKANWKLRYEELKVDALDLHAANAQMAAALRGLLAWHRDESSIILDDLIDNADTALSQEPPASHAPLRAPESCHPSCEDETDCSSVPICRAVADAYAPASHALGLRDDVIEECAVAAELAWTASPAELAEIIRALKGAA